MAEQQQRNMEITVTALYIASSMINQNTNDESDSEETPKKEPKSNISGKEGAKDVPSWAKGERPYVGENGEKFADRLLGQKYGKGSYPKGPGSEHSKIKKWGDRSLNKLVEITMKLYVLQHVHEMSNEVEDTKMIGVYSSMERANTAKDHLKNKPGFLNNQDGFCIDEYELDKTFWEDGFYTE